MRRMWIRWALATWFAGVVVSGLVPGHWHRPAILGTIHNVAALTSLTIFALAATLVSRTTGLRLAATTSLLATAALAVLLGAEPAFAGLAERAALATNLLWLILAIAKIERQDICPRPSGCGTYAPAGTGPGPT